MPELPPLVTDQRQADRDQVRLLSIFHFIGAGLAVLGMAFLLLHYAIFHTFVSNPDFWKNQRNAMPPPRQFFEIFKWFYLAFGLFFFASLVANLLSAVFLRNRTHRLFSMVVAGFNCIHVPLGTTLGVFTIIILSRPSVRELYPA